MEVHEFAQLVQDGNSGRVSAFLSAFFTLVGTHGLHILVGLLWMAILLLQVLRRGLGPHPSAVDQLSLSGIFWTLLDFIFTIVYLMGTINS